MGSLSPPSGPSTTHGTLTFTVKPPDGIRAYRLREVDPITGQRVRNYKSIQQDVEIENVRGKEEDYTLDGAGFQLGHHPAKHKKFENDAEVKSEYYEESVELIKNVTGASKVVIFDHTIRRRRPGEPDDATKRQPVAEAHVDQTTKAAIARVHYHLPSEAPELLQKGRYQLINLWRPINQPAIDWPLTLCDYRSVDVKEDLFEITLVYPDREGETYGVRHSERQKWKYFGGVKPEEYILIKCFDSIQDGSVALFTPHTGFEDPTTPPGTPFRESIELRALVFYD
ncbi:hypothetical protein BDN72DRAFT_769879 [Pluteus cervinus]|uniref:Uncharacterized protein n=1 Tax=Pluteus cervinus TaxID=181527 RepID=A0ACD3AQR1_9AGAR|nr:hypothetical protein BDN72DRAFT_769879 [Pluteus cervinus]